jgi:hypothetical protein
MVRVTGEEILDTIRFIAKHPYMCAQTPEEASALVQALAAVALAENSDRTLQIALRDIGRVLVPRAVTDVQNTGNLGVHLCDECADPRLKHSLGIPQRFSKCWQSKVLAQSLKVVPEPR